MERERPIAGARGASARDRAGELPGDPPGARAALERLRGFGGDRLVRDMAAIFLADMPARRARAEAGAEADDLGAVASAAHPLQSSAPQIGAVALGGLCGEAERAARGGDRASLAALVPAVGRELDGFGRWLERELGRRAAGP
jgi:HPt (histidine-containing phosphotransfer) domain-containing protein